MAVRPLDLVTREGRASLVLHCGECLADYPAKYAAWDWMFPHDCIVCAGCGTELALTERVLLESEAG